LEQALALAAHLREQLVGEQNLVFCTVSSILALAVAVCLRFGYRCHVRGRARALYIAALERDRAELIIVLDSLHGDATAQLDALERHIAAIREDGAGDA
jgi:hypothetical protein